MFLRQLSLGTIVLVLVAGVSLAADQAGTKVMESKAVQDQTKTVNFAAELGLDAPGLATLADRISAAVTQSDPVALAVAARELGAYEKVSGKQAKMKSSDLASLAATIASLRYQPSELKIVAELMPDEKNAKSVKALAEKAEKAQAAAKAAEAAGEKPKGIMGKLRVINRSGQYARLYVNGWSVGEVMSGGSFEVFVGDSPWGTTYLDARTPWGSSWHDEVTTPVANMTWVLTR